MDAFDGYVRETAKREIETGVDFNDNPLSSQFIIIKDAKGDEQELEAQVLIGEESSGVIFIDFKEGAEEDGIYFKIPGDHKLRAKLIFQDGRVGLSGWVRIRVGT